MPRPATPLLLPALCLALAACGGVTNPGNPPEMSPVADTNEYRAMASPGLPMRVDPERPVDQSSLWSGARGSLLGSRRAEARGDILTVVIEIDDEAEFSNSSERRRTGQESLGLPSLFGIPQRINESLPGGANMGEAVSANSNSSSSGDGSTRRNEELTLRVAATVTDVLPNGSLIIEGRQEVRVNYELRELVVTGMVRPEDISRQNTIEYDKIASARISYGGRGSITDVQQPRWGQRAADRILPF